GGHGPAEPLGLGAETGDEGLTVDGAERAELELDARLGGDGVDGDAAGERVRRDRGVGHGIGLVEGPFGPELGGDRVDEGDELGGIGDGVDALGVSEEWAATPWKSTRKTFIDLCPRMTRMLEGSPTTQPRGASSAAVIALTRSMAPTHPTSSS